MATQRTTTVPSGRLWTGAILLLLVVFYLAHRMTRTTLPVRAATVVRSSLKSTTSTNGVVEPVDNFEATAPFPGVIKAVYVHEGDKVAQGKLLLSMDDTDARARLAAALANLKGAQAAYDATVKGGTQEEMLSLNGQIQSAKMEQEQAQSSLAALEKLQMQGAASAAEVAAARNRLTAASNSLAVLEQRKTARYGPTDLAHARAVLTDAQAAYAAAQQVVDQANVKAPFPGTVYSIPSQATEFVEQGKTLLEMADLHKMQVLAYFDEPEVGRLKPGLPVRIQWDAKPGAEWHGHIERVPSTIIRYQETRNVGQAVIAIDDADGTLLPNTNVTVSVTISDAANVLNVPRDALHTEQGKFYVYKVVDGTLHRTQVKTGASNLTQIEVLSGLSEGDTIALGTTNGQPLSDGASVNVLR
ncbi:MAG: efflux RND transporter periplasmic adaptor subunit [Acidobacterium ailaaui]|nr:efflux RND transporter periplasmic adaptor subunit [Pseudacidobacterium ailaaui]MCL6463412.1 efflux RND transporter periplasmic adaptor subunit [Pseudacidobacterium ailaaui]